MVGQGATDFAWEHGIPVVPHSLIVSKTARDRFLRWRHDLRLIEEKELSPLTNIEIDDHNSREREQEDFERDKHRRDHTNALLNGTWNEGQVDSPQGYPKWKPDSQQSLHPRDIKTYELDSNSSSPSILGAAPNLRDLSAFYKDIPQTSHSSSVKRPRYGNEQSDGEGRMESGQETKHHRLDVGVNSEMTCSPNPKFMARGTTIAASSPTPVDARVIQQNLPYSQPSKATMPEVAHHTEIKLESDDDVITDTVGAIAIDMFGNIAAGSSSGGIGMKHRGRVGPAALVGIGTAIIPADHEDEENVSVAAVTSGTGEHMATTIASQKCAERIYYSTKRGRGGGDISVTEEEALESFIQTDFMQHPSVTRSNSAGAIGVMAVKKTSYGYFLYFGHNTDSFALASMHSNEKEPKCVMSRITGQSKVVQGGRKVRLD